MLKLTVLLSGLMALVMGAFLSLKAQPEPLPGLLYVTDSSLGATHSRWVYHNLAGHIQTLGDYDQTHYVFYVPAPDGRQIAAVDCFSPSRMFLDKQCKLAIGNYAGTQRVVKNVDANHIELMAWSPDSTELAFIIRTDDHEWYIERVNLRGERLARYPIATPSEFYIELVWQENRLIYQSRQEIWTLDIRTGTNEILIGEALRKQQDSYHVFSPNYEWLAEWETRKQLNLYTAQGQFVKTLIPEMNIHSIDWAPSSDWILFYEYKESLSTIYRVFLADGRIEELINDEREKSLNVQFTPLTIVGNVSPDENWLLYSETVFKPKTVSYIHARSIDGQHEYRDVLSGYQGDMQRYSAITWVAAPEETAAHPVYFVGGGLCIIFSVGGFSLSKRVNT